MWRSASFRVFPAITEPRGLFTQPNCFALTPTRPRTPGLANHRLWPVSPAEYLIERRAPYAANLDLALHPSFG